MDFLNVDPKFATESRRHTDGVYARHSIRTVLNDYVGHDGLLPPKWFTQPLGAWLRISGPPWQLETQVLPRGA
jgi:hypothetical protein